MIANKYGIDGGWGRFSQNAIFVVGRDLTS